MIFFDVNSAEQKFDPLFEARQMDKPHIFAWTIKILSPII